MILPHKLATTNDQLMSRAGLLAIGQLMESMHQAERVDKHFPKPKSNRGFIPPTYIQTLVLMQHQCHFHLDDARHLLKDTALAGRKFKPIYFQHCVNIHGSCEYC
jgi:hypothetical protein